MSFELLRRVARSIPITRDEGGPNTASTFTYQMRDREDPRVTDRRMQSLLTFIADNLDKASPTESAFLYHALVKLRMPEEALLADLKERCEAQIFDMMPKDLALILWC